MTDLTAPSLPEYCPAWCINCHAQALEEGCSVEAAGVHMSGDKVGSLAQLSNPFTNKTHPKGGESWRLDLRADHDPGSGWQSLSLIHFEVMGADRPSPTHVTLELTPAEALELARVLAYFTEQALLNGDPA